jgi:hypothetical protein
LEKKSPFLFTNISSKKSGIDFNNIIENTEAFNIFSYRNFYNGGGVAIGDINNDDLPDIYLVANMGENKLFINNGDFVFEDITIKAGIQGTKAWSTGAVMVDINSDGYLDIYVCNAGYIEGSNQENELFINNGDLTFTDEASQYNLNDNSYTTHAAFFDYDIDGDLDAYILNNSFMPVNTLNYSNQRELQAKDWPVKDFLKGGGDKLLRNDNGIFVDATIEAGIYSSLIGFGLGVTIGDINGDHLPDMYISNDFFERDYLYINQGNGTFNEEIENWMEHTSLASMGADIADINNDGFSEIFVSEMLPDEENRIKTEVLFEHYTTYLLKLQRGFYHQYMHNTLQLNNGDKTFSEIAWYSGVAASDWSWGALMFDAENDGYKDIYICNGIYQDVTNQDFIDYFADNVVRRMALVGEKEEMNYVISRMPSNRLYNRFFHNNHDLTFEEIGVSAGFNTKSFSNGAAYGDLDNDGDLDLVVNNLNHESFLYRNNSESLFNNHYLSVKLKGGENNTFAIGSKVLVYEGENIYNHYLIPSRGYQSSSDYKIVFGIGEVAQIDSLIVIWPDKKKTVLMDPLVDTTYVVVYENSINSKYENPYDKVISDNPLVKEIGNSFQQHIEDEYVDFYQEGLIIKMTSREGPKGTCGDVNGDGLEDLFIGGAFGQSGQLYIQSEAGFKLRNQSAFHADFEDTSVEFFDADQDGDLDLFVGSGGNYQRQGSGVMRDRVYYNNGEGVFTWGNVLPDNGYNTSVVLPFDIEGDGDLDLFVGSRSVPMNYGIPPKSYIYENTGDGKFKDATVYFAPFLRDLGMVTDATLADIIGDDKKELIIVGEWMGPVILKLNRGKFERVISNIQDYSGWWYAVESDDVDGDGDQDLILGNRGENFYFSGTFENPAKLWLWDFDNNGRVDKIITRRIDGKDRTVALKRELSENIPSLDRLDLNHSEFADKSIHDLFPKQLLDRAMVKNGTWFKSVIAINKGQGNFDIEPLPREVQFSSVNAIYCHDVNGDGKKDLILGGNDSGFMPQYSKLDASFGHFLINNGKGNFERIKNRQSGLLVKGDVRDFVGISIEDKHLFLTLINNQTPKLFEIVNKNIEK